jgi:crotonobetainyl-CoA:carnitine CoA-transferase CaiB-like acyl-CoA transferase
LTSTAVAPSRAGGGTLASLDTTAPSPASPPLRVVEFARGIAAAYCGKLLADSGADVTVVEPTGGHPLRRRRPHPRAAPGALFRFLTAGKTLQPHNHSDGSGVATEAGADVALVDDPGHTERPGRPGTIVVSFSPYGLDGPWKDRPATDFVLQASCGSTGRRGLPDRPPVFSGGSPVEFVAGSYAAAAVSCFAGSRAVRESGLHLDVSLLEAGSVTMHAHVTLDAAFRRVPLRPVRSSLIPSIEPTADGYVGFCTITAQQFQDFMVMIERPDLAADETLLLPEGRRSRREELTEAIRAWTTARTTDEIIGLATAFRIPVAPIGHGENLPRCDHLVEREVFERSTDGLVAPRRPYRITWLDPPSSPPRRAPWTGPPPGSPPDLPLAGLRVADFTAFWAGPSATHLLGALGAEVIKVESPLRPDGMRFASVRPGENDWLEWSPVFHGVNANKRSYAIDLRSDAGRERAWELIRWADVVPENFSPRVFDDLGFSAEAIAAVNPTAVVVRMPAFGLSGPWRDRTGFAMTVEQASGLAWMTGYRDGPPMDVGGVCDPLCGMHAVVALMSALRQRAGTGRGALVEAPLVEVALNVAAEQIVQYSLDATLLSRDSNRGPEGAPQGVYPAAGEDSWVALSVRHDADWAALQSVLGSPAWAADPRLATDAGRREHHDLLDERLAAWTQGCGADEVAERLAAAGIPAARVVTPDEVAANPQLRARGFFEPLAHPVVGAYEVPSLPFGLVGRDRRWYRVAAPTVGQHSAEVERELSGRSSAD